MHAVLYLIRAEVEISGEIYYSQYRYIYVKFLPAYCSLVLLTLAIIPADHSK